jgi:hypothetical protein
MQGMLKNISPSSLSYMLATINLVHVLYVVMDETTEFISHLCYVPLAYVRENYILL